LVILKDGVTIEPQALQKELTDMINQRIGRIACFKQAIIVPRLPKTRSGKILRNTLRQMADGKEYKIPSTIDDPGSLVEIEALMHEKGLV
jgi:propionyl-CoA synthetase